MTTPFRSTDFAGNTKLVPVIYRKDISLWRNLWVRFKSRSAYTLLDTFLFYDANDLAVLITSFRT